MADHDPRTYKLIELVGTSPVSDAEATTNAVAQAGETLRGLGWFQVTELRGLLEEGTISEYQVTLKVGCRVLDHDPGEDAVHPALRTQDRHTVPEETRSPPCGDLAARVGTIARDDPPAPPRPQGSW